ncbi:MAG: hypothetical protein E7J24_27095 [Klebsiella sp.]|nr:hypothetical protein [Klebsiella sp.]
MAVKLDKNSKELAQDLLKLQGVEVMKILKVLKMKITMRMK